ncbi:alpha/beta hydrolase [Paenibacillus sp. MER TA 81-3]|uniref:alpha/beta hydrolase n=1 Tax=Paenibacillus sp. MER TA 81-3 TaxID=2939573 RepID=UPI00203D542A|nr:alpha/beta hydrolase [Paenibacillus sp. MER TA 81-3]MCM3339667.1 alpha/beta hydrolase [Paenibacillus sp. MER TA 81-3]
MSSEKNLRTPRKKKRKWILWTFIALVIAVAAGIYGFLRPYPAGSKAEQASISTENVKVYAEDGLFAFETVHTPIANLILYPGGLVEPESYAVLARGMAERKINTYILKMPLNLAVLDSDGAERLLPKLDKYARQVRTIVGGHSLGGTVGVEFAKKHPDAVQGLILLASYANSDISNSNIPVLSIYGSKDGVLNLERYMKNKKYLPEILTEHVIQGANHAQFGDYGNQKKDYAASISDDQQIRETVDVIVSWLTSLPSQ